MNDERWHRIQSLFLRALNLPEEGRVEYVRTGTDNPEIAEEVLAMLGVLESGRHLEVETWLLGGDNRDDRPPTAG